MRNFDTVYGWTCLSKCVCAVHLNYILPVILVYSAVWAEKNTVPPTIEINVLGQFQEDDVLDGAERDEKKVLDTESSTKYFEIPCPWRGD